MSNDLPSVGAPWAPAEAPPFHYVVEKLRFEARYSANFLRAISAQLAIARGLGWERVLLSSNVTGNPKEICQIWKVDSKQKNTESRRDRQTEELAVHRRFHEMFFQELASFERLLLAPLPYDPGLRNPDGHRPQLEKNDTLLSVQAHIRDGAMARVIALKEREFIPFVEKMGWEMVLAGHVVSSAHPGNSVVQFWHLPEPKSLPDAMGHLAQHGGYRSQIAPLIAQEKQELISVISDKT